MKRHIKTLEAAYSDLLVALDKIENGKAVPCQYAINKAKKKLGDIIDGYYK